MAFLLATVFWAWGQDTPEIPPRDLHRYIDECAIRTADLSGFYFPPGYSGDRANEERRAGELVFTGPIGYIGGYGYTALTTEHQTEQLAALAGE